MPIWLIILSTTLGTLMIAAGSRVFFYYKCKNIPTHSKTSSVLWHKENLKETKAILPSPHLQSIGYPKIKAPPEMVRETLEM